jgi:hypothetical protein
MLRTPNWACPFVVVGNWTIAFVSQIWRRHVSFRALQYTPVVDINKMLADLRAEREQVEEAILMLERLARGRGNAVADHLLGCLRIKRRGRPPGSKNKPKEA